MTVYINGVSQEVIAHAALTTGVHGVGSNHVAGFHAAGQEVSKVIWLDESLRVMDDNNRSASLDWTELDLTTETSVNAKFAILKLRVSPDVVGSELVSSIQVRKNDQSLYYFPECVVRKAASAVGETQFAFVVVGLRSGQLLDYRIVIGTGWTIDSDIQLLGYSE